MPLPNHVSVSKGRIALHGIARQLILTNRPAVFGKSLCARSRGSAVGRAYRSAMAKTYRIRPLWISGHHLRGVLFVDAFMRVRSLFVARSLSRDTREHVPGRVVLHEAEYGIRKQPHRLAFKAGVTVTRTV